MAAGLLAAVKIGVQQTEIREFVMPDVPADAGLLKVEAVGVCGTDVHTYCEPLSNGPFIMGHENVGRIARLGPVAAQRWGLQEGDLVLAEGYRVCGHCESCLSGYFGYCPREGGEEISGNERPDSLVRFQPSRGGGFSQYLYLHPESRFHRIPEHVPAEQATLALPFGNGWQCLRRVGADHQPRFSVEVSRRERADDDFCAVLIRQVRKSIGWRYLE